VKGFIVNHPQLGRGKLKSKESRKYRVRFFEGQDQELLLSEASWADGTLSRCLLALGEKCVGPAGGCIITRVVKLPRQNEPAVYEVTYAGSNKGIVTECELEPIAGVVVQDPLLKIAGLDPQTYSLFSSRQELVASVSRVLREGSGLRALLSSRIDLHPHQAFVAGVVITDHRRRYILADEVGLGKTIEAGIVIHDLLAQKRDARILVLCPGALTLQWLCEMYAKFGGQVFTILDLHDPVDIDWQKLRLAIISTTNAANKMAEQLVKHRWDMVVVDEAHHLLAVPMLYKLTHILSRLTPSLLLLSAIPAQHRVEEFLRLLALLEPRRYDPESDNAQEEFQTLYEAQSSIGLRLRRLSRRVAEFETGEATKEEVAEIAERLQSLPVLQQDGYLRQMVGALSSGEDDCSSVTERILHHVADNYRVNRRILRNRRQRLVEEEQLRSIERNFVPQGYESEQVESDVFEAAGALLKSMRVNGIHDALLLPFSRVLFQSLAHPLAASSLLEYLVGESPAEATKQRVEVLGMGSLVGYTDWGMYRTILSRTVRQYVKDNVAHEVIRKAEVWQNSRKSFVRWLRLLNLLRERANKGKTILFAGFPGVAEDLSDDLKEEFGPHALAEFRHDMSPVEKEENVRRFKTDPKTWLLVSDETGGEGRNFQFADEIIHFDNPWFVSKVEQRIGRLDRIGRDRVRPDVISNVLFCEGTAEAGLVHCYAQGLGVYSRSISGLEFALRGVEEKIAQTALASGAEGLFDLADSLKDEAEEERLRDDSESLWDEASFDRMTAEKYRRVIQSQDTEVLLEQAFVNYYRKLSGGRGVKEVNDTEYPRRIFVFRPDEARYSRLALADTENEHSTSERRGTFRRSIAQNRLDLQFFNVGNPFFDAVLRSLSTEATGRTYAIKCDVPDHSPWLGFEFIFRAEPNTKKLDGNYGMINRAGEIISLRPTSIFVGSDGTFYEDTDDLLRVRRSLKKETHGIKWWNLVDDRAQVLADSFGDRDWQNTVFKLFRLAKGKASGMMEERLSETVPAHLEQIREMIRQAESLGEFSDPSEVRPYYDLIKAVEEWEVTLDSVGFMAINTELFGQR